MLGNKFAVIFLPETEGLVSTERVILGRMKRVCKGFNSVGGEFSRGKSIPERGKEGIKTAKLSWA